jgi:hypothetical protein
MKLILALLALPYLLLAQTSTLRGVVTDESGALVAGARVTLTGTEGDVQAASSDANGAYAFADLAAGKYSVQAAAPQLALPQTRNITIAAGTQTLNLQLRVAATIQHVDVQANGDAPISTDPANSAAALVLRGHDLDALSDDPEDLQADLQALAGPSAGPGGGSIFVDGFSGGDLPPKESIREIRINQSPFSAEYDKLGLGRIEIFTKPGSDKYRGNLNYNLGTGWWNSRNPYSAEKAPFLLQEFENTGGGPINKRASFTLDANQNNVDNGSIVNAVTLDPQTLRSVALFENFKTIQRRTMISPRIDYQLTPNVTLTVRDTETHGDIQGTGIGGFNLTSLGGHLNYNVQTAQFIVTAVRGTTVNDTRFQFYRNASTNQPNSTSPELQVLGSFNTGGSTAGRSSDTLNTYEFQNATSILHGAHTWRFGVRLRGQTDDTVSPQNFNGTFTFGGGLAPVLDANNQVVLDSHQNPVLEQIDSLERYRRTLLFQGLGLSAADIRARGGGATQFSIGAGTPEIMGGQMDAGFFVADDWRMHPNLTWSLGLRYETQTNIHDVRDFAPRIGVAWAPGSSAKSSQQKTVVRAGFGMFYDRFALGNTLTAERYNGVTQQQYVVSDPDFYPNVPLPSSLAGLQSTPVTQKVSATLHAPYLMQSAFTLERVLPRNSTLAVTYTNSLGRHMLRSEDINAPAPGTYFPNVPGSGVFPMGRPGAVFLMESAGVYTQNQLIVNAATKINPAVSLTATYTLNRARSNTDGIGTFPADPYNFAGEYGPASTDVHQRVNLTGTINTKWNLRFSPLMNLQSGPPFDITDGNDPYGTTLFNARPGIATDLSRPGLIQTPYGLLDPNPALGEKLLPRNFGRGPGQFNVNLRIAKTFGLGPERGSRSGGGGIFTLPADHRYNLSVSMSIRNLLNHTNPGPIIGNITSPLFGRANQVPGGTNGEGFSENANNRRLELQIKFAF